MIRFRFSIMMLLVAFVVVSFPVQGMTADSIAWYSYDKGLALAKEKNKKIYINFHADWCGYCRKMEKETFVDKKVIALLNDKFIAVSVNSDKETQLAKKYNVRGLPANFFLTDKGEAIGSQPGYLDAKTFLHLLNFVKDEKYKSGSK